MKKMKLCILALATFLALSTSFAQAKQWSELMDARIANFDFIAPVVMDDTVPPKQAGSIFFNADEGEFQGFNLEGDTVALSVSPGKLSHTYSALT